MHIAVVHSVQVVNDDYSWNQWADANCSDSGADFDCETLGSSIRMTIQLVLREWANLPSIKSSLVIKENSLVWN